MRKTTPIAVCIVALTLLLAGCLPLLEGPEKSGKGEATMPQTYAGEVLQFNPVNSFRDGFEEMRRIDKKYATDFRRERLGAFVVNLQDIPAMENDISRFLEHIADKTFDEIDAEAISRQLNKTERDVLFLFIAARIEMLESERYFQEGYQYGNAGLVGDGFYCSEQPFIFESLRAFNVSVRHGLNATYYIDVILGQLEVMDVTHALIGIDDTKPEFYKAPFQTLGAQVRKNTELVLANCANATEEQDVYVTVSGQKSRKAG